MTLPLRTIERRDSALRHEDRDDVEPVNPGEVILAAHVHRQCQHAFGRGEHRVVSRGDRLSLPLSERQCDAAEGTSGAGEPRYCQSPIPAGGR